MCVFGDEGSDGDRVSDGLCAGVVQDGAKGGLHTAHLTLKHEGQGVSICGRQLDNFLAILLRPISIRQV